MLAIGGAFRHLVELLTNRCCEASRGKKDRTLIDRVITDLATLCTYMLDSSLLAWAHHASRLEKLSAARCLLGASVRTSHLPCVLVFVRGPSHKIKTVEVV